MKYYCAKNYQLTAKALNYIDKYGRNMFNAMISDLLNKKKSTIKAGWIKKGGKKKC